jgi:hypothetical protein
MKINSYPQISSFISKLTGRSVKSAEDKQGGSGQNAYSNQFSKGKDSGQNSGRDTPDEPVTDETVQEAIHAFSEDELNKTSGIHAEMVGQGPGLKVNLKDASGGLLRSVSGEEFLRLRDAAAQGNRSGHILDQKA